MFRLALIWSFFTLNMFAVSLVCVRNVYASVSTEWSPGIPIEEQCLNASDYCAVNKSKCTTLQTQNVHFKWMVISVPACMYWHMETGGWEVGQFLKVLCLCLGYLEMLTFGHLTKVVCVCVCKACVVCLWTFRALQVELKYHDMSYVYEMEFTTANLWRCVYSIYALQRCVLPSTA